jgi:predicted CXXCH cytochrome family protein
LLSLEGGEKGDLVISHQWLAVSVSFLLGIWYWFAHAVRTGKRVLLALQGGLVVLIVLTGHFGGMITHGENFLSFTDDEEIDAASIPDDPELYTHIIQPILDQKCVSCHNPNKSKGQLLLTSYQHILEGGESGAVFDMEHPQKGLLVQRISLPQDAEEHMPPKEEEQLTSEEMILLKEWIENGAREKMRFSELDPATRSHDLIAARLEKNQVKSWEHLPEVSDARIQKLRSNYISIFRLYHQSNGLQVILYPHAGYSAGDTRTIKSIADNIVELDLSGLPLSTADFDIISQMKYLEKLNLGRTKIEKGGLQQLASLANLKELRIYAASLEDSSVDPLVQLAALQKVYAYGTDFEDGAMSRFTEERPDVTIITEAEQSDSFESILPSPTLRDETYFFREPFRLMLEHPLAGIDIFYTLDGSVPDECSEKFIDAIEITGNAKINYFAAKEGWIPSPVDSFRIYKTSNPPDNINLKYEPNPRYPGKGKAMLFDLKKGPLDHNDSSWMAFRDNPFVLTCSWNQPRELGMLALSTYVNTNPYIFPPESIIFKIGSSENDLEVAGMIRPAGLVEDIGAAYQYYECQFDTKAVRYIQIEVQPLPELPIWHRGKGDKGWFFVDEVVVE